MIDYFFKRNSINLDLSTRCTLACPKCWRDYHLEKGNPFLGKDMTVDEFKKIIKFYKHISFCGEISDPVLHPKFDEFLKLSYENDNIVEVRTAVSQKPYKWYIEKAFPANPKAKWFFAIDGLPKDSHKYRIRQDGEKLFDIMVEGKKLGIDTVWTCIIFSYNENDLDSIIALAKEHKIEIEFVKSSRWDDNDPFKPINSTNSIESAWRPVFD
jgi:MoaA/NifB/PqqE/SkfB family radical SAM enzyme